MVIRQVNHIPVEYGGSETPAAEWRKEKGLIDGYRTVNHADAVLLDAFSLEHLEDPFSGWCKE
jgi:hypothetical protein